ncbi:MAG TPA: lipase family protein [Nocardioides sp.]|uniref:lipase family protein n=1 Tax=Nocardioides sp. TaxID=35761 RepID=UPI002E31E985|nr:lipase family protein [Nocardioides sp.]HEX5089623.1 lipase family protein [Nocardioides sp.]
MHVLPRWLAAAVGVLTLLLGAVLIFRPFASLAVLLLLVVVALVVMAAGELTDAPQAANRTVARLKALGWLALAVVVAGWPGLGIRGIAVLLGVALIVDGALDVIGAVRGSTTERLAAVLHGVAAVLLGILALAWPDVTVIVIGVIFGARLIWFGVTTIWAAVRPRSSEATPDTVAEPAGPGAIARSWHVLRAAAGLALTLLLVVVSLKLHAGNPVPDAFYTAPDHVPSEPGQLLRTEPFDRAVPDTAQAWRILYTTTRDEGEPAVASALVVAPKELPDGPRPVIAWAHGTTGAAEGCAPSLLDDPFTAGATPALPQVIDNGWVMVATDYVGLGTEGPHPYLIGQGEGRSVLDAVRAAHQLDDLDLDDRTVVWGHSQGGHAALWTGQLADSYAPDDTVIGVAALAPAGNLTGLIANLDEVTGGSLFASFVLDAYSATYDDVDFDHYVRPAARIPVREMAARCLAEPEVFVSVITSLLFDKSILSRPASEGALGKRLAENVPLDPISAPVFIAQGEADGLILPSAQRAYVRQRCGLGGTVEYRTYPGVDHVGVVGNDSPLIPDLLAWTQDRLDGRPATSTC